MRWGEHTDELMNWLETHKPELAAQIYSASFMKALDILNAETGLQIPSNETVEEGNRKFLEALKSSCQQK